MDRLYTNRSSLGDFAINGFRQFGNNVGEIYIATAFFTEAEIIDELLKNDCRIKLVVRLGFPTSPDALKKIIDKPGIDIRFYTDHSFHPKLYIFGNQVALVGSANLTHSALWTNQEILLSIYPEDDRFSELAMLFAEYWEQARVLTIDGLNQYKNIYAKYDAASSAVYKLDKEVNDGFGNVIFKNINRGERKKSKESIFMDSYSKAYQESVSAFSEIRKIYESFNYRKVPEDKLPIRLEIDSFFSFIRDNYAKVDTWSERPIGWNDDSKALLKSHIEDWQKTYHLHLEETITNQRYPLIHKVFGSEDSIQRASMDEIIEALCVLHSFRDRLRFYEGGLEALKEKFSSENTSEKVKHSLSYLLYGKENLIKRMCDLIYDYDYKLNVFGESNVQELIGWMGMGDFPVINGRTTKILRYYGFEVKQL